jgi:hypothetical protein
MTPSRRQVRWMTLDELSQVPLPANAKIRLPVFYAEPDTLYGLFITPTANVYTILPADLAAGILAGQEPDGSPGYGARQLAEYEPVEAAIARLRAVEDG